MSLTSISCHLFLSYKQCIRLVLKREFNAKIGFIVKTTSYINLTYIFIVTYCYKFTELLQFHCYIQFIRTNQTNEIQKSFGSSSISTISLLLHSKISSSALWLTLWFLSSSLSSISSSLSSVSSFSSGSKFSLAASTND